MKNEEQFSRLEVGVEEKEVILGKEFSIVKGSES